MVHKVLKNQDIKHHQRLVPFVCKSVYEPSIKSMENYISIQFMDLTYPFPQVAEQGLC